VTRPTSRRVAPAPRRAPTGTETRRSEHGAPYAPVRATDPARMTPAERRAELGALLAAGYARQLENLRNGLAGGDHTSPVCEGEAFDCLENRSTQG
jgi:hypothetical protein